MGARPPPSHCPECKVVLTTTNFPSWTGRQPGVPSECEHFADRDGNFQEEFPFKANTQEKLVRLLVYYGMNVMERPPPP
ncbi:hypothetical protein FA95DRAFT_1558922 [Auriscalpium vulgare]|uniref:Uncharacterized protein n=1 Tax=Auriscalpium vulgare TaxID=40419 RepID=A0ACB8RUV4_9AGAM|nr:hypothetical protein FA95DRAFT_1558922 [Auriscalpium vulgare]